MVIKNRLNMRLEDFARQILFGTTLEDKLMPIDSIESSQEAVSPIEIPSFPGRPAHLAKPGKAHFPSIHQLHKASERGKVLHFFANHELLAMELMALVLLRFPDAPSSFRNGIVGIIQEEQSHLRLYLSRMKELGVEFGDIPVNDYFWNVMKGMKSPLDFTVQMSMTFEQANLDFSLFFMNAVAQTGDEATAKILERVFLEEIGHVKHGLKWFNRWRDSSNHESEWDAYLRLLPFPLNPQRAKGFEFSEESRREAGFSENFIRELKVYSGSKGRPPVLWYYNPHCDSEIARGKPGFTPSGGARSISQDLETVPLFLSLDKDVVLVQERPRTEWIEYLQKSGFKIPEIVVSQGQEISATIKAQKIGGVEPWGWSPDAIARFKPLLPRLVEVNGGNTRFCKRILETSSFEETGIKKLFSKSWSVSFLREWIQSHSDSHHVLGDLSQTGIVLRDWESTLQAIEEVLASENHVMVKAPYGTSGMQVRRIRTRREVEGPLEGWIRNILSDQGEIVVEPYLDKIFDLSIQMEISDSKIQLLETRRFMVGERHEYRGTYLGRKIPGFTSDHYQFFYQAVPFWHNMLRDLGQRLREIGYCGPAGVDAFLWKGKDQSIRLKPLVELNPRWTMGRVALEIEKTLSPGVNAVWLFLPLRDLKNRGYENAEHFVHEMQKKYPLKLTQRSGGGVRIESGVVFTNDWLRAKSVLTLLSVLSHTDLPLF
jgi:uncharacterized ferritin-like protein (DUF455 family)